MSGELKSGEVRYRAALLIVSDRVARDGQVDGVAPVIRRQLADLPFTIVAEGVLPDEQAEIEAWLLSQAEQGAELLLTSGGTGFGPRDVTPEATRAVIEREAPGIAEAIRAFSMQKTRRAMLGRGVAGIVGSSLVINLPGSPGAAAESLEAVADQLAHAMQMLAGGRH